ncbi:MAG TPA: hypothetical protein VGF04_02265 [Solirubrobacterales bacterium]|jgi:hypothetical protein
MRLLLATHSFAMPGGSETYLLTVAQYLEQLGHEVTIFTLEPGEMSESAAERGLRIATPEQLDGGPYDAIAAQDGVVSYALEERFPSVQQLFIAHTADYPLQFPPQASTTVGMVVAMNDRVAERLESLAHCPPLLRLRQPIDVRRFTVFNRLNESPASMLLLSNYVEGDRLEILREAARRTGIALNVVGRSGPDGPTVSPEMGLRTSDIVFGNGRAALEAMACGRSVYVYGHLGADGWVTPESYEALERDGFASLASERIVDADRLCADLADYSPAMGSINRSIAVRHHEAGHHASQLVEALRELGSQAASSDGERRLQELARLVRVQWQTEVRVLSVELQLRQADAERVELEQELERARSDYEAVVAGRGHRFGQALGRLLAFFRRRR